MKRIACDLDIVTLQSLRLNHFFRLFIFECFCYLVLSFTIFMSSKGFMEYRKYEAITQTIYNVNNFVNSSLHLFIAGST